MCAVGTAATHILGKNEGFFFGCSLSGEGRALEGINCIVARTIVVYRYAQEYPGGRLESLRL